MENPFVLAIDGDALAMRLVDLGPILDISDAFVVLVCVPNILALHILAPIVKREMRDYMRRVRSGEIVTYG